MLVNIKTNKHISTINDCISMWELDLMIFVAENNNAIYDNISYSYGFTIENNLI